MALTAQEKELIRLQSKEIAFEVCRQVLIEHTKVCPHGKALLMSKWLIVGVLIGTGVIGGGGGFALAKMVAGM